MTEWLRLPLGQFIFALESYSNGSMALQFGRTGDNDSGLRNLSRRGGGMGITSEEGISSGFPYQHCDSLFVRFMLLGSVSTRHSSFILCLCYASASILSQCVEYV